MYAILAEEVVVEVYESCLSECGEQLPLLHAVHVPCLPQLSSAASHGTARHENHLVSLAAQPRYLVCQRGYARDVELAVGAGKHVASRLYHQSHSFLRCCCELVVSCSPCCRARVSPRGVSFR